MLNLEWKRPVSRIAKEAAGGDNALKFMAGEARRLMEPYVPMETGTLAGSAVTYVEGGAGVVHYRSPYAARLYFGEEYRFRREYHPKAGGYWDRAMLARHRDDLLRAVQAFIQKRGLG